ncbi:MAG: exosome complex RNA-binding protein Csl4 [Candidatus Diapherotrites archaeon]|nr:exosome complex RNA-binding protein Csl4 [Candidatus Diapherotrites archaeon]
MQDDNKLVFPGDLLGAEEEFLSGKGTFEKNGKIYSKSVGYFSLDRSNHSATVTGQASFPAFQRTGDVVFGSVVLIRDKMVMIDLIESRGGRKRKVPNFVTAILRISDIDRRYVDSAKKEFGVADIVKVKIKDLNEYTVDLTTAFPDLGVVKGYCPRCRHEMQRDKRDPSKLKCAYCGKLDSRKVSADYGNVCI